MNNTHIHFHYLQQKLQEWKANDLLFPPLQLSWMRFQEVATRDILPALHEARAILEAEGLDVSITDLDEETRSLGLYVKDVGIFYGWGRRKDDPSHSSPSERRGAGLRKPPPLRGRERGRAPSTGRGDAPSAARPSAGHPSESVSDHGGAACLTQSRHHSSSDSTRR